MTPPRLLVLGTAAAVAAVSCAPRMIEPAATATIDSAAPFSYSDWSLTLSRAVIGREVDYARLARRRQALDRFLAKAARVGPAMSPAQFPTRGDQLAYFLNCYNAAILRAVLELSVDGEPPHRVPADLETRFTFRVDGRTRTAADLRMEALALADGDWRIPFALFDGTRGGPPPPSRPFLGDMLDAQLDETLRHALDAPQIVTIDHEWKLLYLWRGLYDDADALVRAHEQRVGTLGAGIVNVLLTAASREQRARLNAAVGYPIRPMATNRDTNCYRAPADDQAAGT